MRRLLLPCLLLLTILFSSCGLYERKQQILLCKDIIATHDTLDKMTDVWHQLMDRGFRAHNFTGLRMYRIKMGEFVSRRRIVNGDLELPASALSLRDSEEVFLANRADIIANAYPPFEEFTDLTPPGTIQNQLRSMADDQSKEIVASNVIRTTTQAFIKKHDLRISAK
jgi:hypothetical protein